MNRIMRFTLLSILYLVLMIIFYIIPAGIFWMFGAPFLECLQHPVYVFFCSIAINVMLGIQFYDSFDEDYYPKK